MPALSMPRLAARFAAAVCIGLSACVAGVAHAGYVMTEVVKAGADSTSLFDINDSGTMVGYSVTGSGLSQVQRGFIYDGATFTELSGPAGSTASAALGISSTGMVVGSFYMGLADDGSGNVDFGPSSGFIYTGGSYTVFIVAGATDTFLRGISPDGRYWSGYYSTTTQPGVGFVYDSVLSLFRTTSAPNSLINIMQGINSAGIVVGSDILDLSPSVRPGVIFDIATGTRTEVQLSGAERTALRAIEDDGTLAGWYRDAANDTHGFVGSLLNFETIDFAGADATFVEGSNALRTLVGNYNVGDTSHAFVARLAVPEPANLLLVAAALGLVARQRRAQASS